MKILYIDCFYGFSLRALAGALCEVGIIENNGDSKRFLSFLKTERMSLECTLAEGDFDTLSAEICDLIESKIRKAGVSFVMSSAVPLCDFEDGRVISLLEKAAIKCVSANDAVPLKPEDAIFLSRIVNDCGPKPTMDIISVGYGAGDGDRFLSVTVGEYNSSYDTLFVKEESMECI